jgi:ABC-2 type transport system ATP-binding protein
VPIVVAEELSKVFVPTRRAAREPEAPPARGSDGRGNRVSFRVESGTIVGYIGPNGPKSTTIKMLTGIHRADRRHGSVCGLRRSRTGGVQPGSAWCSARTQPGGTSAQESFSCPPRLPRGRTTTPTNLARFVDLLDLGPLRDVPVRQLSLGQRMRGDLAAALLHDPDLVLLDEPTIGLDVIAKDRIRTFIRSLAVESGTTVLLTTHDLDDVEQLSDRVLVIDRGRRSSKHLDASRSYGGETLLQADLEQRAAAPCTGACRPGRGPRQWLRFRRDEISATINRRGRTQAS